MPTGVGIKTRGDQEKMLLKASLSTGLYLRITVDNLFTVMNQKWRKTSCMPISGLQGVEVDEIMAMRGIMETLNSR